MHWRLIVVATLIVSFIATTRVQADTSTVRFVDGPCQFSTGTGFTAGNNVRCGTLVVPENPALPAGTQIRLAVAIFRTPSANRKPDPVVFLQGGPGGPIVDALGPQITTANAGKFLGDHDLILIDQRGTGLSRPLLTCPEVDQAQNKGFLSHASVQAQLSLEGKALQACHDRLTATGINLSAYNTTNNAADIASLRIALALPQIDLYGVSYGTRLALAVMRYYPTGIRSVVLDSIVPPQYNLFADSIVAEGRAFNALFAGCKAAAHCHKKYPHLQRTFDRLLRSLNQHPVPVPIKVAGSKASAHFALINGENFAELVRSEMYVTPLLRYLPDIIAHSSREQKQRVGTLLRNLQSDGGLSRGLYESIICAEDAPFVTPAALSASLTSLPKAIQAETLVRQQGEVAHCALWNVAPADPTFKQPVASDIPTLLLGGEYDPITPPANVALTAQTLSHSYGFQFPGTGHGVRFTNVCPDGMISAFYNDPSKQPDNSCISGMKEPFS